MKKSDHSDERVLLALYSPWSNSFLVISPGDWKQEFLPFILNYNLMASAANIFAMKILNKDELAQTLLSLIFPLIICFFAKPRIFLTIDLIESA